MAQGIGFILGKPTQQSFFCYAAVQNKLSPKISDWHMNSGLSFKGERDEKGYRKI
jgi:hypothetical protein